MPVATQDQASAIEALEQRCRADFEYACETVLWIRPKEQALVRLQLLWPQRYVTRRYLLPAWERREPLGLVVLKTRRIFMTTLFMAWLYHGIRWFRGQNCYVLANDDPTLADVYGVAQRFHSNLPVDFRPPVARDNTEVLSYAAPWDSALRARVAQHHSIGRGTTLHRVLWDEAAFTPNPEQVLLGFLEAVPRTSASGLILSSTANGEGTWWHRIWQHFGEGQGDNELGGRRWQAVFLAAWQNPHNRLAGGRVPDRTDYEQWLVERFQVDEAHLAWRRAGVAEYEALFPGAGNIQWMQENPNTPEEAFQSAMQCIFAEEAMTRLRRQWRVPAERYTLHQTGQWRYTLVREPEVGEQWSRYVQNVRGQRTPTQQAQQPVEPSLYVWEPPLPGYEYAVGVDVGLGVGGDDSTVVVLRYPGWVQVAEYADNVTAPKQFSYVVGAIADWYGRRSETLPIVCVELNNAGILINTELEVMTGEYQLQTYVWEFWDRTSGRQQTTKTGWLTTWQTKHLMVGAANSMLMAEVPIVPSEAVWVDMSHTYEVKPGVYRTRGADLAMAWLLALVTVYRKYARFDWGRWIPRGQKAPASVFPDADGRPDDAAEREPWTSTGDKVYHDTAWARLQGAGRTAGPGVDGWEQVWEGG